MFSQTPLLTLGRGITGLNWAFICSHCTRKCSRWGRSVVSCEIVQMKQPSRKLRKCWGSFGVFSIYKISKIRPHQLFLTTEDRIQLMIRVACLRAIIMGAPLRDVLKHLLARVVLPKTDQLMAVLHRPGESFFVIPQVIC
jgi:hypothetical protein